MNETPEKETTSRPRIILKPKKDHIQTEKEYRHDSPLYLVEFRVFVGDLLFSLFGHLLDSLPPAFVGVSGKIFLQRGNDDHSLHA